MGTEKPAGATREGFVALGTLEPGQQEPGDAAEVGAGKQRHRGRGAWPGFTEAGPYEALYWKREVWTGSVWPLGPCSGKPVVASTWPGCGLSRQLQGELVSRLLEQGPAWPRSSSSSSQGRRSPGWGHPVCSDLL